MAKVIIMTNIIDLHERILQSREDRAKKQEKLLETYPFTLISFTLNIPGIEKRNELYFKIHREGSKEIINNMENKGIEIKHREEFDKITGQESYIVVDYDPIMTKKMMIKIEDEHFLGRIFDIDVFDSNHYQISRSDLLYNKRQCLLCDKDAYTCMRERNHTYEELVSEIHRLGNIYFNLI